MCVYPFDLLRTKIATAVISKNEKNDIKAFEILVSVLRTRGISGLYYGY